MQILNYNRIQVISKLLHKNPVPKIIWGQVFFLVLYHFYCANLLVKKIIKPIFEGNCLNLRLMERLLV